MVNGHSKCILLKVATFCRKVTIRSLNLNLPLGLQCISFFPNKSQSVELANELKVYQSFQFHFLFQSADPARFMSPSLCGLVVQQSMVWMVQYLFHPDLDSGRTHFCLLASFSAFSHTSP